MKISECEALLRQYREKYGDLEMEGIGGHDEDWSTITADDFGVEQRETIRENRPVQEQVLRLVV